MPRSFNLPKLSRSSLDSVKDPRVFVRIILGLLLAANLAAAAIAFNLFTPSPEQLGQQLVAAQAQLQAAQSKLTRSRLLSGKIDTGRTQGSGFLVTYVTGRRHTYSTIIGEITEMAKTAGMKTQEWTIAPLDPIEGTEDLDMMTISINFEGAYNQLVKFVNLIDRSPRFLIIDSMTAAPRPNSDIVSVNLKLNTFVKEDAGGPL